LDQSEAIKSESASSIGFVIGAIYTFTFVNAVYNAVRLDPDAGFALSNVTFDWVRLALGAMCLVTTLRFFFGNNIWVAQVLHSERSPWVKLYQLAFIGLESSLIAMASFEVSRPRSFLAVFGLVFLVESIWFALTHLVDRPSVAWGEFRDRRSFYIAQALNLAMWIAVALGLLVFQRNQWLVAFVGMPFAVNTAYDLRVNLAQYLGDVDESSIGGSTASHPGP